MNWIEINEDRSNLPTESGDVLITDSDGSVTPVYYFTSIACMPLPEPFKKQ